MVKVVSARGQCPGLVAEEVVWNDGRCSQASLALS
jgi:hypothetical protein